MDRIAPILQERDDGLFEIVPDGAFFKANSSYRGLAQSVIRNALPSEELSYKAAQLNSKAIDQQRLPQFTPRASINQSGDPVARIGVSQLIHSNGGLRAEQAIALAREQDSVVDYLIAVNRSVEEAILTYFDIRLHAQTAEVTKELEKQFAVLVEQAERRVAGGVGDETEIETFKLKLLEATVDYQESKANQRLSEQRLAELTGGHRVPQIPPSIVEVQPKMDPPEVLALYARIDEARGNAALERANRKPRFSLDAFSEINISDGATEDGVSIGVGLSKPLGLRNDLEVSAAEIEVQALETELANTRNSVNREISKRRSNIARDQGQIRLLQDLSKLSEKRLEMFEESFLSGAMSFEEAVSVLDTYRRSKINLVEARHNIMTSRIEIARIQGMLVPAK